jgi:CRISPR-associated protein Cas5d
MYGVTIRVWGDYACFTRPEMKVERVTYDVITPSAARGVLEAIHWKPAIKWVIDEIHICKPIELSNIARNERKSIIPNPSKNALKGEEVTIIQSKGLQEDILQRTTIMLVNVEYVIKAHFEMTEKCGDEDTQEKHYNIFLRRARKGQCFNQPYLGCREFSANFSLIENEEISAINETRELGYMLYDIDFENKMKPMFFKATMVNGCIKIPSITEVVS